MLLVGICKKCNEEIKLDVGSKNLDEVKETLKKMDSFHCPGKHVELSSPYPNYWDINNWVYEEGKAIDEEGFLAGLKENYTEVIDTEEMTKRGIIKGFAYGFPITTDGNNWNFVHSPKGKRWYIR